VNDSNSITIIKDIVTIAASVVAVVTVLIAIRNYQNSVRQRRAEWLDRLYERFYEKEHYKEIRRILDYQPGADFQNLQRALSGQTVDHQVCENFVNYLNFFEHVASLWRLKQLSQTEMLMLFEYYLRLLRKIDFVWAFIQHNGFESLTMLLRQANFDPQGGD
jgi:hypothetical protein